MCHVNDYSLDLELNKIWKNVNVYLLKMFSKQEHCV